MKLVRKLFTIAIAFAMMLGLGTRAFAADDPKPETPLEVTGLDEGDVAHFYKILEWDPENDDAVGGWVAVEPFDSVLTPAVLEEVLIGTPDDPDTQEDETVAPTGITAELAGELARVVTTASPAPTADDVNAEGTAGGDPGTFKATFDNTKTEGEGEDQKTVTIPGLWMVLITPADVDTSYNPVFVASDFTSNDSYKWDIADPDGDPDDIPTYSDSAAAKKSKGSITKTATTCPEDPWDATDEELDPENGCQWTTTAIGDTVTFTVETTIPGYGKVFEEPHFVLTDKLASLALVEDEDNDCGYDIVVTGVPATYTDEDGNEQPSYEIDAEDGGYTITFDEGYLKTVNIPTAFTVTYKALVTTDAPYNVNEEDNEVWTEYSHDPTNEDDYKYQRDTTQHYTFTIDADGIGSGSQEKETHTSEVVKVGQDAAGNPINETTEYSEITDTETWEGPLAGAEFKLYTDEDCEDEYVPKDKDGNPLTAETYVSLDDGRFTIKGLDAGTYYLREEKAPAGFIKDSHVAKIEIIATFKTVEVTQWTDGDEWVDEEDDTHDKSYTFETEVLDTYTVKIDGVEAAVYHYENEGTHTKISTTTPPVELPHQFTNTQGTELPSTGGMGTTLFYTIGGLLVLGGGILLVSRRRMAE